MKKKAKPAKASKPKKLKKTKEEKQILRKKILHAWYKIGLSIAGALCYAIGVGFFLEPNHLTAGGVAGIAQLIDKLPTPIETGTWILLLNIPILYLGFRKFGAKFLGLTFLVLIVSSPLIDVFVSIGPITTDPVLASISGGALLGCGMGLFFRGGATSGGVDVIIKLMHARFPHIKSGIFMIFLDGAIILLTAGVYRDINVGLYSAIGILVSSYLMNMLLYGTDEARMVYIISDNAEALSEVLVKKLSLGVTVLNGYGAYTGKEKKVLFCVMRPKQMPFAREVVAEADKDAFMVVAGASSVFGEGFKSYSAEDL